MWFGVGVIVAWGCLLSAARADYPAYRETQNPTTAPAGHAACNLDQSVVAARGDPYTLAYSIMQVCQSAFPGSNSYSGAGAFGSNPQACGLGAPSKHVCLQGGTLKGYVETWDSSSQVCPSGWALNGSVCERYSCPQGGQLVGQTCVTAEPCVSGPWVVGVFPDLEPIYSFRSVPYTREAWGTVPSTLGGGCEGSCGYVLRKRAWVNGDGFFQIEGTGQTCSGNVNPLSQLPGSPTGDQASNDEAACLRNGGFPGTVQGNFRCLPRTSSSGEATGSTSTSTTTTTNPDGTTETRETTQQPRTVCLNGECVTTVITTTIITTRDGQGNVTGTSTTTTETQAPGGMGSGGGGEGGTCDPAREQCGEGSKFGGSCAGGFVCDGDAVQCAIAREQHRRMCMLDDAGDYTKAQAEAAFSDGRSFDAKKLNGESRALSSLDSSPFLAGGSLPDHSITVAGTTVVLPFSSIGPYLQYAGVAFLAVCGLIAFRIVARGTE